MKNIRAVYVITAVLTLFTALFLPLYPAPEWVMAETGTTLGFYNAAHMFLRVANPLDYWTVSVTLAVFIPAFLLFICALIGRQIPFLIAALIGLTMWLVVVWRFIGQFGFSKLIAFNGVGFGFGIWVALALFLAAAAFGIVGKGRHA